MYQLMMSACGLSLASGLLLGSLLTALSLRQAPPMQLVEDPGTDLPIVQIQGIYNGALTGFASSGVRLSAGGQIVPIDGSGSFSITDSAVLINHVHIQVPHGMLFVASRRGKKYYSVTSKSGQNITPTNRLYFPSKEAAEKAGYRP